MRVRVVAADTAVTWRRRHLVSQRRERSTRLGSAQVIALRRAFDVLSAGAEGRRESKQGLLVGL
jgi:hypothetical protein